MSRVFKPAIAYMRTSSAANVGEDKGKDKDKDNEKRQVAALRTYAPRSINSMLLSAKAKMTEARRL